MSASDELTIWMLSTARNAPSVAPMTASQVLKETWSAAFWLAGDWGAAPFTSGAGVRLHRARGSRLPSRSSAADMIRALFLAVIAGFPSQPSRRRGGLLFFCRSRLRGEAGGE